MFSHYFGGNPLKAIHKSFQPSRSQSLPSGPFTTSQQGIQFRILVVSWNMAGSVPNYENLCQLLTRQRLLHDLIVIGTQQCEHKQLFSFFFSHKHDWENILTNYLRAQFEPIQSEGLAGTHLIIFARFWLVPYIRDARYKRTYSGFKGLTGSKGAVSLYMHIGSRTFNFINCHLKADHHNIKKRNQGLQRVLKKLSDRREAEQIFIFGDLNYRFGGRRQDAHTFIAGIDAYNYKEFDQLKMQQEELANFLHRHFEGPLHFGPTYKFLKDQYQYDTSRTPGWTDRIFFQSKPNDMKLNYYQADFSVLGSDHRPVLASFTTRLHNRPAIFYSDYYAM